MDITSAIKAKSDQLNASDLIGGPVTARIEQVKRGNQDQPVIVHISGGHMPWKPSKTALRAMAHFLGTDTSAWVGRWVRLYRDPRTLWAGKPVGGVMVSGIDGIKSETLTLPYSRGKTQPHQVQRIEPKQEGKPTANLEAVLTDTNITVEQLDAWAAAKDKPPVSTLDDEARARLAQWLSGRSADALDEIRGGGK